MGPKRDKSKKEKMRETRRQGDPSFPSAAAASSSGPQHASRIPRPSILLSGRQNAPQQESHAVTVPISEVPKEEPTAAASKGAPGKGLRRVTFDLTKNRRDDPQFMSEEVAECWEDLSDGEGSHRSDEGAYQINDEDIIDCEREFGDLGDEFLDIGGGESTSISEGGPLKQESSKVNFFIGPRHIPGLNDIEDFGAIGDDDDEGSDYDNVESNRNYINIEQNVRYFSDDNPDTPPVHDLPSALTTSDTFKVELPKVINNVPVTNNTKSSTAGNGKDGSQDKKSVEDTEIEPDTGSRIPFIDGMEESTKLATVDNYDDDDDEWQTEQEQSGGSDDSGKIYRFERDFSAEGFGSSVPQTQESQDVPHPVSTVLDDRTLADPPSLGEEDSDIITNEDFDAAFHSVMKEEDESVPERLFEERSETAKIVEYNPFLDGTSGKASFQETKPESNLALSEEEFGFTEVKNKGSEEKFDPSEVKDKEENRECTIEKPEVIHINLRQTKPELIQADQLVSSADLQQTSHINIEEKKTETELNEGKDTSTHMPEAVKETLEKSEKTEESVVLQESSMNFIGPLEKPSPSLESQVTTESVSCEERTDSPNVTIGFECREEKTKSVYSSETESEGELVVGEDKCVGTADDNSVGDEPLDLSVSEKTSSKDENDMSESRDSLSLRSEDESLSENFAPDVDKYGTTANLETNLLDVPAGNRVDTSPSPEIPAVAPIGNSESGKEKEKINEKKNGKKKGKKNKRDGKLELAKAEVIHPDRPRLVRGKTWKEKREKFKVECGDALPLSFGNELCESEIVEGTSNLLTETYTEASLLTASRCSTETTIVTETPCTACSSLTGEFSESESLCKGCLRGDRKRPADALAQVTEMKACNENLCHTPTVTQMSNEKAVFPESENGLNKFPLFTAAMDKDDFYVVKACEVAGPLEVHTEYVVDSESNGETSGLLLMEKTETVVESIGNENSVGDTEGEPELFVDSSNSNSSDDQNPVYFDAKDSSCADKIGESYDYLDSFPGIVGTQNISYIYSYDDAEYERQTDRPKLTVKPLKASLESSGVMMVNLGEDDDDNDTDTPLTTGEILYEGPCMCGPHGKRSGNHKGHRNEGYSGEDDLLCVPPLFGNNQSGRLIDIGQTMGVETHEYESHENMGSPEDNLGNSEGDSKDIRSRIKEIVGPRLNKRGRHAARRRGGACGDHAATVRDHEQYLDVETERVRDESPMPGSSPASSSGVQGSDEMSPSRSHSCSPSPEGSVSPPSTIDNVSDLAYEVYQARDVSPTRVKDDTLKNSGGLRLGVSAEVSPEKGVSQVDYSFKTFSDMYQINPVYTTDSDDREDRHESDTIVQSSSGLSYDPDRSITVSSWGSTSEESPAPQDPSTSPPLPSGGRGPKKVPKVTKQLRETQGIVQRWEVLQAQAVERQRQSSQVRELQRQVKNMRLTLENLAEQAGEGSQVIESLETHPELDLKLQEAKALLEEVRARKAEVSSLNLAVHRFFTDSGYSLAQLKDEVNDLYILYDEAHRRATSEVSRLEGLEATWKLWEAEAEELTRALRQDGDTLKVLDAAIQTGSLTDSVTASMQDVARLLNERRKSQQPGKKLMTLQHTRTQGVDIQGSTLSLGTSGDDCLSDSGTSGYESCSSEELSERERRLAHLRRLARDLEASLSPDSQAWQAITKTLSTAENELKGLQKHCRDLVVRSTETLDQTKSSPQLRRRSWAKESKVGRMSRSDRRRDASRSSNGRRGWMWRVVRAALPFQAALLLLFCVACLLEPNCCDTHNSLTMTLTPQLRYVHGPPPV